MPKEYTWRSQRADIQHAVNDFFAQRIEIAPRAMAALQANDNADWLEGEEEDSGVFEVAVLESLMKSAPAAAMLLFKAGVDTSRLAFPPTRDAPAPLAEFTLDWIFRGVDERRDVPTATRVRESRKLTELDILLASLEAAQQGPEPNDFGGHILKAAGLKEPRMIREVDVRAWQECDTYLETLTERVEELVTADPSHYLLQFVLFTDDQGKVRVRPFSATGLGRLGPEPPISEDQPHIFRGGILQPVSSVLPEISLDTLGEFEALVNATSSAEPDFQKFFERHPSFLIGFDFRKAHPQPILTREDGGSLIPDFFLEALHGGWDTILDLKLPYDEMVTRRRNRVYFKQHVQNAVAQLRFYREWFDSPTNRKQFRQTYGVETYRPRMVIVVGRHHHFRDDVERIRLIEGLPDRLELWTYDDLLQRAHRYLGLFR